MVSLGHTFMHMIRALYQISIAKTILNERRRMWNFTEMFSSLEQSRTESSRVLVEKYAFMQRCSNKCWKSGQNWRYHNSTTTCATAVNYIHTHVCTCKHVHDRVTMFMFSFNDIMMRGTRLIMNTKFPTRSQHSLFCAVVIAGFIFLHSILLLSFLQSKESLALYHVHVLFPQLPSEIWGKWQRSGVESKAKIPFYGMCGKERERENERPTIYSTWDT